MRCGPPSALSVLMSIATDALAPPSSLRALKRWIRLTTNSSSSETRSSTTETAAAPGMLPDSIWLRMKTEETSV